VVGVYVDRAATAYRGMVMCHMLADSLEELHSMADTIGLRREWFQDKGTPHYDVSRAKRALALRHGAMEIDRKRVVEIIRAWRDRG
jgi:hypothetical protein